MKKFEIFLQENEIAQADWQRLVDTIGAHEQSFSIEVEFDTNNVNFFLYAEKDLSLLTTNLEGFILKPLGQDLTGINETPQRKRLNFRLPRNKNILEIREN